MDGLIKNDLDLFVTGEIGYDFQAGDFIRELNFLSQTDEEINVHIYSGGGSVFDALAVYDFVKLKGIKLNVYISGLAGSAATIISAAAGKENTYIGANSFYFIHNAFDANSNEQSDILDNINSRLVSIYQDLTGLSKPQVTKLLKAGDNGEFLTPKQAKDLGFVKNTFKEAQLAASIDWYKEVINKSNNNNMDKPTFNVEEFEASLTTKVLEGVKNFFTAKEKEVSSEALENQVKEYANSIKDEVVNSFEVAKSEKENELQNKITELEANVSDLESKLNASSAEPIEVVASSDPEPQANKGKKETTYKGGILSSIYENSTDIDKLYI